MTWRPASPDRWFVLHALCINIRDEKYKKKLQSYTPNSIRSRTKILCTSCLEDVSIFVNEMSFIIIVDCSGMREKWLPKSTILYPIGMSRQHPQLMRLVGTALHNADRQQHNQSWAAAQFYTALTTHTATGTHLSSAPWQTAVLTVNRH